MSSCCAHREEDILLERKELYGWKGLSQLTTLFSLQGALGILVVWQLLRSAPASWSPLGLTSMAGAVVLVFCLFRITGPTLARFELVFIPTLERRLILPMVVVVVAALLTAAIGSADVRGVALKVAAANVLVASILSLGGALFFVLLLRRERHSLARMREHFERFRAGEQRSDLLRIQRYLEQRESCSTPGIPIRGIEFPGLTSRPWHERSSFAWIPTLENAYPMIRDEVLGAVGQPTALEQYDYFGISSSSWKSLMLFSELEGFIAENCAKLPQTMQLLRSLPIVPAREVMVSVLAPRSRIPAHRDAGNTALTCQLAIQIPTSGCGIRVGREERIWTPGKAILFDTTYEHEVWNDSDETRIVFLFDFLHPDLTATEQAFFERWSSFRRNERAIATQAREAARQPRPGEG
jgi:beta-hydroxylase